MAKTFIAVVEYEGGEVVELPLEEDMTLSLGTLHGQFPGSCGLKYRSDGRTAWRGLRVTNDVLSQVNNDWSGNHVYVVVFPRVGTGNENLHGFKMCIKMRTAYFPEIHRMNISISHQ